jgi:hypothetical protein
MAGMLSQEDGWRNIVITLQHPNSGSVKLARRARLGRWEVGTEYCLGPIHGALPTLSARSSSNYYTWGDVVLED